MLELAGCQVFEMYVFNWLCQRIENQVGKYVINYVCLLPHLSSHPTGALRLKYNASRKSTRQVSYDW